MTNESRMRRTPQQARGQRRVFQILDAAAAVFAETGYEAATTNAIAIRANTSIGSLYQFFPDKRAILDALAIRYQGQISQILTDIAAVNTDSLQGTLDIMIDRIAEFSAANPAFQLMFVTSYDSKALTAVAETMSQMVSTHVNAQFLATAPALDPEQSEFYASIVVFLMRALIPPGVSSANGHFPGLIDQLKYVIAAYLRSLEPFQNQPPSPTA